MNYIETLYFTYQYELVKISADTFSHQLDRFSTEYPVISIVLFFFKLRFVLCYRIWSTLEKFSWATG